MSGRSKMRLLPLHVGDPIQDVVVAHAASLFGAGTSERVCTVLQPSILETRRTVNSLSDRVLTPD